MYTLVLEGESIVSRPEENNGLFMNPDFFIMSVGRQFVDIHGSKQ